MNLLNELVDEEILNIFKKGNIGNYFSCTKEGFVITDKPNEISIKIPIEKHIFSIEDLKNEFLAEVMISDSKKNLNFKLCIELLLKCKKA